MLPLRGLWSKPGGYVLSDELRDGNGLPGSVIAVNYTPPCDLKRARRASGLGKPTRPVSLPQPLDVRALRLRPGIYPADHGFAQWVPQPLISLRLLGEGVHHLLVAVQAL